LLVDLCVGLHSGHVCLRPGYIPTIFGKPHIVADNP
jgi:hypothetical protein